MANSKQKEPKPKEKIQKIRILELIQKNFAAMGVHPNLAMQMYPLNDTILWGFLILTCSVMCNLMYTLREAKTFADYTQSIYMLSLAALLIPILVITLLNVDKLFNLVNELEKLANTGKWQTQFIYIRIWRLQLIDPT